MSSWAGNLIKVARLKSGLSQRELARRARTSQSTIATYEAGRKEPTLPTLARIVAAAGLDLRIRLTPHGDHDEWIRGYERRLPPKTRERARRQREGLRARGRARARGA